MGQKVIAVHARRPAAARDSSGAGGDAGQAASRATRLGGTITASPQHLGAYAAGGGDGGSSSSSSRVCADALAIAETIVTCDVDRGSSAKHAERDLLRRLCASSSAADKTFIEKEVVIGARRTRVHRSLTSAASTFARAKARKRADKAYGECWRSFAAQNHNRRPAVSSKSQRALVGARRRAGNRTRPRHGRRVPRLRCGPQARTSRSRAHGHRNHAQWRHSGRATGRQWRRERHRRQRKVRSAPLRIWLDKGACGVRQRIDNGLR